MPGYVIHLSIAEEYLKKHDKKENYAEFIEGVIFPDSVTDKSLTHYGPSSSQVNLYNFLKEHKLNDSFTRGYFLHLLTDYLFYNKYINFFSKDIYNDYDILNKELIKKYDVKLPDKVKKYVFFKENMELKILSYPLIETFVKDVSDMDIDKLIIEINQNINKWIKIRPLKKK